MWKDFFYFSRTEKQAVCVLILLVVIIAIAHISLHRYKEEGTLTQRDTFEEEYNEFVFSLEESDATKPRSRSTRASQPSHQTIKENHTVTLTSFDPNTADSLLFHQLGLPARVIKNILRYRDKGGKFRRPEDFRKMYGLPEEQYNALLPYIRINDAYRVKAKDTIQLTAKQEPAYTLATKYPTGTVVSLNNTDTTELKRIPGIGSYTARKIVNYRKQLGGFYCVEQLHDIAIDPNRFAPWLRIEDGETIRINIHTASVERLKAHPYINFYQAQRIVEHRKRKGNIKQLAQLAFYEEFTEEDLKKIAPYVHIEP